MGTNVSCGSYWCMASLKCHIGIFCISLLIHAWFLYTKKATSLLMQPQSQLQLFFGVGVFSNFCFIFFGQITLMVSIAMLSDWPSRTCQVQIRLEPLKESWIMQTSFVLKFVWKMFFQYWNMFFCFFASQGFLDLSIYISIFSHV